MHRGPIVPDLHLGESRRQNVANTEGVIEADDGDLLIALIAVHPERCGWDGENVTGTTIKSNV